MKYTITINQRILCHTSLTLSEAAILNCLISLCNSTNSQVKQHRREGYTWVNSRHIIKELPLLRTNAKSTIIAKIHNVRKAGFIEIRKNRKNWLYVKLLEPAKVLYIKDSRLTVRFLKQYFSNIRPGTVQFFAHNHYTSDNITSNDVKEVSGCATHQLKKYQEPLIFSHPKTPSYLDCSKGKYIQEYEGEWSSDGDYFTK